LGVLLRHEPDVPYAAAHGHPGWLSWVSYHRVWLVPYASALLVVFIEVLVGVFGSRPLPAAAHAVLVGFWFWAVGRGSKRHALQSRREKQLGTVAKTLGIPEEALHDEFAAFMAWRDQEVPPDA
jgi:hypothetical protein